MVMHKEVVGTSRELVVFRLRKEIRRFAVKKRTSIVDSIVLKNMTNRARKDRNNTASSCNETTRRDRTGGEDPGSATLH